MSMLEKGLQAPNFCLSDSSGQTYTLDIFKGQKLVIYFYPKDDTPGCTLEAKTFSELVDSFSEKKVTIVGVSKDSSASHKKFIEKYDLKIRLLSDEDCSVAKLYGAWGEKKNYGRVYEGLIRTTVLIDEKGIVESIWKNVRVKGHVEKVLDSIIPSEDT